MRRVAVNQRALGFPLAEPPIDERGRPLAPGGTVISAGLLDRLAAAGVQMVLIEDPAFADLEFTPLVSEPTFRLAAAVFGQVAALIAKGHAQTDVPSPLFSRLATALIEDAADTPLDRATMLYPQNSAQRDLVHALNRASLAVRLAFQTGLARHREDLAMAALAADLGMWHPSVKSLADREDLAVEERETLQSHPRLSVSFLGNTQWSAVAKAAVAQHHERLDGSGYPKALAGDQIHPAGQLLAVCDVYTTLLLQRPNGQLFSPQDAFEDILAQSGTAFRYDLVETFNRMIPPFPVGTEVLLSSGFGGVVIHVPHSLKSRPRVRLIQDPQNERLAEPRDIDLAAREHQATTIVGVPS